VKKPLAAVDIGTNSIRLLIQKPTPEGWVNLLQQREIVRLGSNWNREGQIPMEKIEKAFEILESYREEIKKFKAKKTLAVGTEALRRAKNGLQIKISLEKHLGEEINIITGEEEARLSYLGAAKEWAEKNPWVLDIGGGSTELVGPCGRVASFSLGALELFQRFGEGNFEAMERYATQKLASFLAGNAFSLFIGVGGTIANLAAIKEGLEVFREEKVHGTEIERTWLLEVIEKMKNLPQNERGKIIGLEKGREDIIIPGAIILKVVLEVSNKKKIVYSGKDILQGMILNWAGENGIK